MTPLIPVIGGIIEAVGNVADDLHTSDEERSKMDLDAYNAETTRMQSQTKINEVEAASQHWLAANWRPALGWVGVTAMAYQFVIYPFLVWFWTFGQAVGWIPVALTPPPILETEALWVILTGMLGIGTMRSFDKKVGTAK